MKKKGETRDINTIPPEELNQYLCEFFVTLQKQDGSDYEPSTIECIKSSIERHLRDKYYPVSIINDRVFSKLRDALKAKKTSLKKKGLGRKSSAAQILSKEDESLLRETDELGVSTPRSLQFSLFFLLYERIWFEREGRTSPNEIWRCHY